LISYSWNHPKRVPHFRPTSPEVGTFIPMSFRLPSGARKGGICFSIQRAGAPFPADFAGSGDSSFPCHSDAPSRARKGGICSSNPAGGCPISGRFCRKWGFSFSCHSDARAQRGKEESAPRSSGRVPHFRPILPEVGIFILLSFRRPSAARKGGICSSNPAGGCSILTSRTLRR